MSSSDKKVTARHNGLSFGVDPMERLASFRPPRDYTLGAAKVQKVFKPNLNVTRNKNIGPAAIPSTSCENKKEDYGREERRTNRQKTYYTGHKPEVIKSDGVFFEGTSKGKGKKTQHKEQIQDSKTPVTKEKQTPQVKGKIVKELDAQKNLRPVSFPLYHEGTKNCKDAPIKLPMDGETALAEEKKPCPEVKKEFSENDDDDVFSLLNSIDPKLILIKFPDSLPGISLSNVEGWQSRQQQGPSTSTTSAETSQASKQAQPEKKPFTLKDMEEGRIGKLQVRRSGRVTMQIGNNIFDVTLSKTTFHQEAISVATNDANKTAAMTSLGSLCHKMSVFPNWDSMMAPVPAPT